MKTLCILLILIFAGCASRQPLEDAIENRAKEKAMIERIVQGYQHGGLSCEDAMNLVEQQIISWQVDSIMEHTYR